MTAPTLETRAAALDAYLSDRAARGFRVETRTRTQAVIHRRRRAYLLVWWLGSSVGRERRVVSVDEDGTIVSVAAQPVRW